MNSVMCRVAVAGLVAAGLVAGSPAGRAEDSNRNEVRANLERDGWSVVWGKNFTEADWARGLKAIAESVAAENPGPFLAWFGQVMDENLTKIERNLRDVSRRDLERWVVQSLRDKTIVTYGGLEIEAGFATYNRWERVVYDEPRTGQRRVRLYPGGPWTYVPYVYTERVERKLSLPNWHQFYVRYKLKRAEGGENTPGNRFEISCGAVLRRLDGDLYELRFDGGEVARYRYAGTRYGGQAFTLADPAGGPFGIHTVVVRDGYLGKVYAGQGEPTFHQGWDGRWVQ